MTAPERRHTVEDVRFAGEFDVEGEPVCIVGAGGRDLDPSSAERAIAGGPRIGSLVNRFGSPRPRG